MMTALKDRLPSTLTTARLVLATPAMAHVPQMAVLANNKRVYEVLSRLPHPYGEKDGEEFVTKIARGETEFAWSILAGGTYLGTIGLHILPNDLPELGYWLGEPHWGQGFATEAGRAVVDAARAAGAAALRSRALLSNSRSRNVLKKLGFTEIGERTDKDGTLKGRTVMLMRLEFDER
jgi:RimJ/RimL family protein N-acetyltransferase